jgi:hypothetical protein
LGTGESPTGTSQASGDFGDLLSGGLGAQVALATVHPCPAGDASMSHQALGPSVHQCHCGFSGTRTWQRKPRAPHRWATAVVTHTTASRFETSAAVSS